MKILHINSIPYGGAYRAAFRIHEALLKNGVESNFLVLSQIQNIPERQVRKKNVIIQKFQWRMRHHLNWEFDWRRRMMNQLQKISGNLICEAASLPVSDSVMYNLPEVGRADIIHLHWVSRYFDYHDFFTKINKPVVWTLHDMNSFSGIFHYREDKEKNRELAGNLDSFAVDLKIRLMNSFEWPISVVAPSEWLAGEAKKSNAFRDRPVSVIPHALDLSEFVRSETGSLRQKINISSKTKVLLAVAENTSNFRKGFDILIRAIREFPWIKLLLIGSKNPDSSDLPNVIYTGSIHDNELLSEYYSLADATIIPSREDNLPNVMLESLACGTPVISFRVGGMLDHVKDFYTGMLAVEMTPASLAKAIAIFLENKNRFDPSAIRRYAESHFNEKLIAEKYMEVYNQLL